MSEEFTLYSYWRSSASWRVRIILNLKRIQHRIIPVNLLKSEHLSPEYSLVNPNKSLPTLKLASGAIITQSPAIAEFLEEKFPEIPLLPGDILARAQIRELCSLIGCDIHPVQNLRVLKYVGEERKADWAKHFIGLGLTALEIMVTRTAGIYCVGDAITMADVFLVPQYYNAVRFSGFNPRWCVDMDQFPTLNRIYSVLAKNYAFILAHPDSQVDAIKA